jgi:predicted Zn-dependent protease
MPVITKTRAATMLALGVASVSLAACIGGEPIASTGSPITASEAQQGAEAHPQLLEEFGGAMSGPQADYVTGVGRTMLVQSGLGGSQGDFHVTLLNSSINNAFAIPGGYVYVTRQLTALMNNEAELAAVLGHEIGHVAARHSAHREAAATRNQLLGVLGQVISGAVLGDSQLGQLAQEISSTAPQLLTLKYSRTQELEADDLGISYLGGAGYNPRAMSTLLADLALQNSLEAQLQGRGDATAPAWASTHPDPASRVQNALAKAQGLPGTVTNRDTFLARIDNILYGDDPQHGVIEGRSFIHPVFRLRFDAPDGFYMINGTSAVSINGNSGQAQLSTASYNGNLESYVRSVFTAIGGDQQQLAPQSLQRTTINGLPVVYGTARVNNGQQQVDVVVYAYEFANNRAFHFATIVPAGQANVFAPMFNSMRRISASEAAAVTPRRIDVVTVQRGDTVASLAARMAYDDAREQRFRVLNGLDSSATVAPGDKVKIVIRTPN